MYNNNKKPEKGEIRKLPFESKIFGLLLCATMTFDLLLPPPCSVIPGTQKIWVRTWGCSHNSSDGEYMAGQLAASGYKMTGELSASRRRTHLSTHTQTATRPGVQAHTRVWPLRGFLCVCPITVMQVKYGHIPNRELNSEQLWVQMIRSSRQSLRKHTGRSMSNVKLVHNVELQNAVCESGVKFAPLS